MADQHRVDSDSVSPSESLFATDPLTGADVSSPTLHVATSDRHEPWQEILDDLHEFVELSPAELRVLDHPALVRLQRLKQLGMAELVFPNATHVRREHSIGTLHVAHLILEHLDRNIRRVDSRSDSKRYPPEYRPLTRAERAFTRVSALIHDVGHLPSGHTFEDELGLIGRHDHRERLTLILDRPPASWDAFGGDVELATGELPPARQPSSNFSLREILDLEYDDLVSETGLDLSPTETILLLVAGDQATIDKVAEVDAQSTQNAVGTTFRIGVCRDIVSNTVSADLIDYLHRDWEHLGRRSRIDKRLLQYMEIRRFEDPAKPPVLAVDLRSKDDVRTDAVSGILGLLDLRYQLFETALYHRTKLNAASMLERVVAELADAHADTHGWLAALPERLLDISDHEVYVLLLQDARSLGRGGDAALSHRMRRAEFVLRSLRQRNLYRKLIGWSHGQVGASAERIQELYSHRAGVDWEDPAGPARNRLRALRLLERDFGLQPLTLAMYCPPGDMSEKIAMVRVRVDDSLSSLYELEKREAGQGSLTGGRLLAETRRFHQLWRVHFTCERIAEKSLETQGMLPALGRAIRLFVLEMTPDQSSVEDEIAWITGRLVDWADSPYREGYERLDPDDVLAAARRGTQLEDYPTRYPAISSFFRRT